ncbi:MAG: hypothetical protein RL015_3481 [Verrucomicrobiota bacterium]|jgi:hypothetical protein
MHVLDVTIEPINQGLRVRSQYDSIDILIRSAHAIPDVQLAADFAAWLFLPLGMIRGQNLRIHANGSHITCDNARKLAEVWAAWMPEKFSAIEISFSGESSYTACPENRRDLCFYSGGVDSTYSLISRLRMGLKQSLLTVHGMDYAFEDEQRFTSLIEKTAPFAGLVSNDWIQVKTNAYSVYNKYKINTPTSHVTHIFALSGAAFLFSQLFSNIVIAADYRLDQQFTVWPWGSNSVTNPLFSSGLTSLSTHGDNVTRAEKMATLLTSPEALASLSFCVDYSQRPYNCGVCSKCMRTKLMFFAATGVVPSIFRTLEIDPNAVRTINLKKKSEVAFFLDLYGMAKQKERLVEMPYLGEVFNDFKTSLVKNNAVNVEIASNRKSLRQKDTPFSAHWKSPFRALSRLVNRFHR